MTAIFALRRLGVCATVTMLAGCGVSQTPVGNAMPQISPITDAALHRSWMIPGAARGDLLYAAGNEGAVYLFTYPGGKLVGTLSSVTPSGMCSDANGNVWITNYDADKVVEYAHGGSTPIKTLHTRFQSPQACSVDPTTGNLATVGLNGISIFAGAKRHRVRYFPPEEVVSCGYDNSGNLFFDGWVTSGYVTPGYVTPYVGLGELRKGATKVKQIALPFQLSGTGNVQWDGKYITISGSNAETSGIFRFNIRGDRAVAKPFVELGDMQKVRASWIQGSTVVATTSSGTGYPNILIYKYPNGGDPIKMIGDSQAGRPFALTVSRAPK
jgi:hypothetical protein